MPPCAPIQAHHKDAMETASDLIKAVQNDPIILCGLFHSPRKSAKLLPLDEDTEVLSDSDVRATIVGCKEVQGVTYYVIQVERGGHSWKVERRFSDFLRLQSHLVQRMPCQLPGKGTFGFRKKFNLYDFKEIRLKGLEEYLFHLARLENSKGLSASVYTYVDVFLGLTRHLLAFGQLQPVPASFKETTGDGDDVTMIDLECTSHGK